MVSVKPLIALIFCFVGVLLLSMWRGHHTLANFFLLKESQEKLKSHLELIEQENLTLSLEIEKIQNSSEYARKILKDKYHLLEQGEEVIFLDNYIEKPDLSGSQYSP